MRSGISYSNDAPKPRSPNCFFKFFSILQTSLSLCLPKIDRNLECIGWLVIMLISGRQREKERRRGAVSLGNMHNVSPQLPIAQLHSKEDTDFRLFSLFRVFLLRFPSPFFPVNSWPVTHFSQVFKISKSHSSYSLFYFIVPLFFLVYFRFLTVSRWRLSFKRTKWFLNSGVRGIFLTGKNHSRVFGTVEFWSR